MSQKENEILDQAAIDPPDNQGPSSSEAVGMDSGLEQQAIDPPDNQGGGGAAA